MKKLIVMTFLLALAGGLMAQGRSAKRDNEAGEQSRATRRAKTGTNDQPINGVDWEMLISYFLERRSEQGLPMPPEECWRPGGDHK